MIGDALLCVCCVVMRMMRVGENSNSEDSMRCIENDDGDFDDDELRYDV